MTFHNIESKKFAGKDYYTGYSAAGIVEVHKSNSSFGNWAVYFGNSQDNQAAGIVGKFVGYGMKLSDVSKLLDSLK